MAAMVWMAFGNAFGQVSFVERKGTVSMINNEGESIIKFKKNKNSRVMDDFNDGWGRICVNGKYGLADENGWIEEPLKAELYLYDGFYVMRYIGKVGVKTRDGKWLLEPTENTGKAVVRIGDDETGVMGYVDRNGKFTSDKE